MKSPNKAITNFLFELGMMKKIEHSGTKFAGIKNPDSIGEHSCRAAQIGYLLACMEKANPEKVSALCIMHDIGEIRIGDTHRIANHYFDTKKAEARAVHEQSEALPSALRNGIRKLWAEFHSQKTPESRLARDADLLETMLQAKEYFDIGYRTAARWIENGSKYLKSASAKKLFREIQKTEFTDWWDHLNKV